MKGSVDLKTMAIEQPPSQFTDCRAFLQALYSRKKLAQRRYSYRQLAEELGFSKSNLIHLIIQGKRPLTESTTKKIVESLGLKKQEKHYFLAMAKISQAKGGQQSRNSLIKAVGARSSFLKTPLEKDQYTFYSDWWHAVVREMVALDDFDPNPKAIAEKIWPKISVKDAEESIDLLKRLNLICYDEDSCRWIQTNATLSTGPQVKELSVTAYHLSSIPHGLEAMAHLSQDSRNISALTLAVNQSQFEEILKEIQVFQDKILKLEQDKSYGHPDRVVQLNMQFFPSTKNQRKPT